MGMNALVQSFGFGEHLVRIVDRDGAPWFVANDVCAALEIGNTSDAMRALDEDEKSGVGITDPHGREQQTTIISEPGVYKLVFRSRKPVAKIFRRWLAHDVLPAIRRTGCYIVPDAANDQPPPDRDDLLERQILQAECRTLNRAWGRRAVRAHLLASGRYEHIRAIAEEIERAEAAPIKSAKQEIGTIGDWAEECTRPSSSSSTAVKTLHASYENWCRISGLRAVCLPVFRSGMGAMFSHKRYAHGYGLEIVDG